MIKETRKSFASMAVALVMAIPLAMVGCGGGSGGGGSAPAPTASIVMQPSNFDFGSVTEGNLEEVPARRFTIRNEGQNTYSVSSIRLEGDDAGDFVLDLSPSQDPCGSGVVALSPGSSCGFQVRFAPGSFGAASASLVVQSNDPVASSVTSSLQGTYVELLAAKVAVAQLEGCPRELPAKAYVSVTDQGDFPIKGLGLPDFRLLESSTESPLDAVSTVGASGATLSLIIAMDYSGSIREFPEALANLEAAAGILVQALNSNDEANILKYAGTSRLMLDDFSSSQAELLAAIDEDTPLAGGTAFFDAIDLAIESVQSRTKDRRAVVILADGEDTRSSSDLTSVIEAALADGTPVFTVGVGALRPLELGQVAAETGGIFFEPTATENLEGVYQQLASLLFEDQYILSYMSGSPATTEAGVEVQVEFTRDGRVFSGSESKTLRACGSP